mmetsp:Transcript_14623/g.31707  ORF Transcript_14623/g.31707 Transcript_14623/m.31707 type:complete len:85 (+) Transcript_14623:60-314(+)
MVLKTTLVTDANAGEVEMPAKNSGGSGTANTMAMAVSSSSTVGTLEGSGTPGPTAGTVTVATNSDVTERILAEGRLCRNEPNDN